MAHHTPFSWRIVIADNASTDQPARIAAAPATDLAGVELLQLPQKGRGRALRAAWLGSEADLDIVIQRQARRRLPG